MAVRKKKQRKSKLKTRLEQELKKTGSQCLFCKGKGYKLKKPSKARKNLPKMDCVYCNGTGQSEIFYDRKGLPLITGHLVRVEGKKFLSKTKPIPVGTIMCCRYSKINQPVVEIVQNPDSPKSYNHGFISARPEEVKLVQ